MLVAASPHHKLAAPGCCLLTQIHDRLVKLSQTTQPGAAGVWKLCLSGMRASAVCSYLHQMTKQLLHVALAAYTGALQVATSHSGGFLP